MAWLSAAWLLWYLWFPLSFWILYLDSFLNYVVPCHLTSRPLWLTGSNWFTSSNVFPWKTDSASYDRDLQSRPWEQHKVDHFHKGILEDRGVSRLYARREGEKASSEEGGGPRLAETQGKFSLTTTELESRVGGTHSPSDQSSRAKGKPLTADDSLVPKCCCDQLPAFGGVLGAGFFFTVASPEKKDIYRLFSVFSQGS